MELVVARMWLEAYMEVVLLSYMLLSLELYMKWFLEVCKVAPL